MSDENVIPATPAPAADPITEEGDALKARVAELEKQCDEYLNGWKRAKADYINFKNEQEKRSGELSQVARMTSLIQYLPVVENFRKAFGQLPENLKDSEWVKGVENIYKQMKEVLKGMGVTEVMGLIGKPFDPASQQAVGQEYRDEFEENSVTQEIEAGYTFNGSVIVPAKVIVNKKPQPTV